MYKLCLLLDEWDNDRNFVGYELEEIVRHFEVTVICNSASVIPGINADFVIYKKGGRLTAFMYFLIGLADPELLREIVRVIKSRTNITKRISEVLHFYINARMFRSFMKRKGYLTNNTLYYSYWYFWKCYALTGVINRYKNSRIITRAHGYDLYDEVRPSGYQPFKRVMDPRLYKIVFISEYGRDYYLNRYNKWDEDKYILSNLGTKRPNEEGPYENDGEISLVSCSRMIPLKRIHRIIDALAVIDDHRIKWIHFGDGNLAEELKSLSEEKLGNKNNIRYEFKGQVSNSLIHDYYRQNKVDAFITTSESEGNPVSVMEAMSYGIPVIAPSICNFPNMIGGGGILLSEKCDVKETSEAIMRFGILPADDIMKMRRSARRIWEEKYDLSHNTTVFMEEVLLNC